MTIFSVVLLSSRDRIVVSTLRCGRNNPGSNPGHGTLLKELFFANSYFVRLSNSDFSFSFPFLFFFSYHLIFFSDFAKIAAYF